MHSNEWMDLFRLIPPEQHTQIVLLTSNGIELSVDTLLRTEPGQLIFRGRVCGQNDDGRLFFLPYANITYVYVNRFVKEDELREILGPLGFTGAGLDAIVSTPQQGSIDDLELPPGLLEEMKRPATATPSTSVRQTPVIAPPEPVVVAAAAPKAVSPPPPPSISADAVGPKSSILDRLRAQRNSMKGAKK